MWLFCGVFYEAAVRCSIARIGMVVLLADVGG
jgi:hypothetical protein